MDNILKLLDKSLDYVSHELIEDTLYISAISNIKELKCPDCGTKTTKVHSRYPKSFADLPIQGLKVIILMKNKNMFCINKDCKRYTFSEKFDFLDPNAKKTKRLVDEIIRISLTQSSTSAARYLSESVSTIKKSSICNYLKKNFRYR
jgi:transposase